VSRDEARDRSDVAREAPRIGAAGCAIPRFPGSSWTAGLEPVAASGGELASMSSIDSVETIALSFVRGRARLPPSACPTSREVDMTTRLLALGSVALVLMAGTLGCFYVVAPGERGVHVTLGTMADQFVAPGFGVKMPLITQIWRVNVQQDTREISAECFSSDLQQITMQIKVLYRIPETSVVSVLRDYAGHPFEKLILPRVQEAVKEVTAMRTAADIVKSREQVKSSSLIASREKIGDLLIIEDLVIEDVALSKELEQAIEAKMVQQQEAEKAVFRMQQARTDAETLIIKAKADAESIRIQGEALEKAPKLVELKMVEKWNGVAPQVVGAGSNILLPLEKRPE
jgi:prohibitin 2